MFVHTGRPLWCEGCQHARHGKRSGGSACCVVRRACCRPRVAASNNNPPSTASSSVGAAWCTTASASGCTKGMPAPPAYCDDAFRKPSVTIDCEGALEPAERPWRAASESRRSS